MSRSLPCFRAISGVRSLIALAATAFVVTGCAGANNVTSSQGDQPYQTSYGLSSAGTTSSLYTELFGPAKPAPAPATATAAAEPVQGAGASAAPQAPPAGVTSTGRQTRAATASATAKQTSTQVQPSPPPVEVAQQPVTPQPPSEPDTPVAYGITANGPTTDLYTELFGPRRSNGQ